MLKIALITTLLMCSLPVLAQSDIGIEKGQQVILGAAGSFLSGAPSTRVRFFNRDGTVEDKSKFPFGQVCTIRSRRTITIIGVEGDRVLVSYAGPAQKPLSEAYDCSPDVVFFLERNVVEALLRKKREEEEERNRPERLRKEREQVEQNDRDLVKRLLGE